VPIQDALLPVLRAYKLKTGGSGLLFPPEQAGRRAGRNGTPAQFMRPQSLHKALRVALASCGLPPALTWYQSTRHTFASHWVMADGSIEKLATVLGHSSTEVTRRYAHLRPEHFRDADRQILGIDLRKDAAEVVPLANEGELGPKKGHAAPVSENEDRQKSKKISTSRR
jgi:integrase